MKISFRAPVLRGVTLLLLLGAPTLFGAKAAKTEAKAAEAAGNPAETKNAKREEKAARAARGGTDEQATRQLERVRERMNVPDDTEWTVIADRIHKVEEARREVAAAASSGKGAAVGGEKVKRAARGAQPEFDALRSAVGDQYPDAEIKSRLARVHETYVQRETALRAAENELRSVLSVRQEAVAVMAGLLTP